MTLTRDGDMSANRRHPAAGFLFHVMKKLIKLLENDFDEQTFRSRFYTPSLRMYRWKNPGGSRSYFDLSNENEQSRK